MHAALQLQTACVSSIISLADIHYTYNKGKQCLPCWIYYFFFAGITVPQAQTLRHHQHQRGGIRRNRLFSTKKSHRSNVYVVLRLRACSSKFLFKQGSIEKTSIYQHFFREFSSMFQCSRICGLLFRCYFLRYGNIVFFLITLLPFCPSHSVDRLHTILPHHVPTKRYYDKILSQAIVRFKEKTYDVTTSYKSLLIVYISRANNIVPMSIDPSAIYRSIMFQMFVSNG